MLVEKQPGGGFWPVPTSKTLTTTLVITMASPFRSVFVMATVAKTVSPICPGRPRMLGLVESPLETATECGAVHCDCPWADGGARTMAANIALASSNSEERN